MQVFLFANDGPTFNGYKTPSTVLYDSGGFTLQTPQQAQGADGVTWNFDLSSSPVTVSSNFTFAAVVTRLDVSDLVGFELFTNGSLGDNYGDFWIHSGGGWNLTTNSVPGSIGARFEATPEPSALCFGLFGGFVLLQSRWPVHRKQSFK